MNNTIEIKNLSKKGNTYFKIQYPIIINKKIFIIKIITA